jgi:hypothetical protein
MAFLLGAAAEARGALSTPPTHIKTSKHATLGCQLATIMIFGLLVAALLELKLFPIANRSVSIGYQLREPGC